MIDYIVPIKKVVKLYMPYCGAKLKSGKSCKRFIGGKGKKKCWQHVNKRKTDGIKKQYGGQNGGMIGSYRKTTKKPKCYKFEDSLICNDKNDVWYVCNKGISSHQFPNVFKCDLEKKSNKLNIYNCDSTNSTNSNHHNCDRRIDALPGLINTTGTACYLNSSMKLLFSAQPFIELILINYDNLIKYQAQKPNETTIVRTFTEFVWKLFRNIDKTSLNNEIKENTNILCEKVLGLGQQSAGEYIGKILQIYDSFIPQTSMIFHSEIITELNGCQDMLKENYNEEHIPIIDLTFPEDDPDKTFDLIDLFSFKYGITRTFNGVSEKCIDKYSTSDLLDDIKNLLIEEEQERINNYKQNEIFPDIQNQYQSDIKEIIQIHTLPPFLIIEIQRMNYIIEQKSSSKLDYPMTLDFRSKPQIFRPESEDKNKQYELIGAIYHSGGYDGGHYIAVTKFNNKWYVHDDEAVNEFPQDNLPLTDLKVQNYIYPFKDKDRYDKNYQTAVVLLYKILN